MRFLFLLLPLIALVYVFIRIWHLLPFTPCVKTCVVLLGVVVFLAMILSFFVGFDNKPIVLSTVVYEITTSWLFILLYLLMIFVVMDLLRLVHILPKELLFNSLKGTFMVVGLIIVVFVYGNINYYHKERKEISIKTDKKLQKPLKIVMISDLHLGFHNQRKTFAKWVDMINKEKADMILIAGDIIDISTYPLFEQKVFEEFHRLNAPVYACLGNHEYFSHKDKALDFYNKANITLLKDSVAQYKDVVIIGRDDRSNIKRKPTKELVLNVDKEKYLILLDHQPYNLEESQQNEIDFQFSGHTHYGQVFPINLITKAIYEKAWGQYKKGKTDYYISSGLGIWGGKFRIGTKSEYVVVNISN